MSEAGQHLDFLVATKVMGLGAWLGVPLTVKAPIVLEGTKPAPCIPPPYSTDIAAAWELVSKYKEMGLAKWPDGRFHVIIYIQRTPDHAIPSKYLEFDAVGETAPVAICLAALKAVGIDEEE